MYGTIVKFSKGKPIVFPDFTLTYIGKRSQPLRNGLVFTYSDFQLEKGNKEKIISWSSGTGDIAPNPFEFGEKKFAIELSFSEKYKRLKEDELVISIR